MGSDKPYEGLCSHCEIYLKVNGTIITQSGVGEEWDATYTLLIEVKKLLDKKYQPQGYNLGWNCDEVGGQHILYSHFHVLPRYEDKALAGKGIRYMFKGKENKRKN